MQHHVSSVIGLTFGIIFEQVNLSKRTFANTTSIDFLKPTLCKGGGAATCVPNKQYQSFHTSTIFIAVPVLLQEMFVHKVYNQLLLLRGRNVRIQLAQVLELRRELSDYGERRE